MFPAIFTVSAATTVRPDWLKQLAVKVTLHLLLLEVVRLQEAHLDQAMLEAEVP